MGENGGPASSKDICRGGLVSVRRTRWKPSVVRITFGGSPTFICETALKKSAGIPLFAKVTQITSARLCRLILGCFLDQLRRIPHRPNRSARNRRSRLGFNDFGRCLGRGSEKNMTSAESLRQEKRRHVMVIIFADVPYRWQDDLRKTLQPSAIAVIFAIGRANCQEICQPDQLSFARLVITELISEQIELALQFGGRHSFARGNLPEIFICMSRFSYRFARNDFSILTAEIVCRCDFALRSSS